LPPLPFAVPKDRAGKILQAVSQPTPPAIPPRPFRTEPIDYVTEVMIGELPLPTTPLIVARLPMPPLKPAPLTPTAEGIPFDLGVGAETNIPPKK
jgi:hypothetical protein